MTAHVEDASIFAQKWQPPDTHFPLGRSSGLLLSGYGSRMIPVHIDVPSIVEVASHLAHMHWSRSSPSMAFPKLVLQTWSD